jgi:hypothetical protein
LFRVKSNDFKKHKGEYLNWVVRTKGIKITVLTAKVGVDRSTFYNHIKDPSLPYHVISKYGEILNHDFSAEYPKEQVEKEQQPPVITTFDEMEKDRDFWKSKYLDLESKLAELINRRS